ncbi:hypothetical protein [Streptomyces cyaneofuscatus]
MSAPTTNSASSRHCRRSLSRPPLVRATLNSLGYTDERIHHLQHDGRNTRFHLDLREDGGRLCESGLAAGAVSDVVPCVAVAEGPFTIRTEERP